MKKQVVVIGGGTTFDSYKEYLSYLKNKKASLDDFIPKLFWKETLARNLGNNYQVLVPTMPNKTNAKYREWKIWFERLFPFLKNNIILIGHSLGGIFLAKYLSTSTFPKKIKATILVAAPFESEGVEEPLSDFDLPKSISKLRKQGGQIYILHSKDDPVVAFGEAEKYKKRIPDAEIITFKTKGHFITESFPELLNLIKKM